MVHLSTNVGRCDWMAFRTEMGSVICPGLPRCPALARCLHTECYLRLAVDRCAMNSQRAVQATCLDLARSCA